MERKDQTMPPHSNELEDYKATLEYYKAKLHQEELNIQIWAAGFKEIVGFATLTIKSLILINGGAIATILAFLGNSIGKSCNPLPHIGCTLELFLWGLGLAIACSALAYVYQSIEFETTRKIMSYTIRTVACICAIGSFGFFIRGCYSAIDIFS